MKPPAEPVPKMVVAGTVIQGAKGKSVQVYNRSDLRCRLDERRPELWFIPS